MDKIWAIAKKEFYSYFVSPIAYIVLAMFLVISGYFFWIILVYTQQADLRGLLANMAVILVFVSPMITMRLIAEEKKLGTIEFLFTSPIRTIDIVLGKYLACLGLFFVLLLITGAYPLMLGIFGNPDWGPLITAYLGFIFLGMTFLAVGLFGSSLTENQIAATVISFTILLLLWIISWVGDIGSGSKLAEFLSNISVFGHFEDFAKGVISTTHIYFYLAATFFFLFLTTQVLEKRRW